MTAPAPSGSFVMVDPAHVAEVGPAAALLFSRICWRAERTGEWKATREVLSQETGLTAGALRSAIRVLRDAGWVQAERASVLDATLVWRPVSAGQAENVDSTISTWQNGHLEIAESTTSEMADLTISSYETRRITPLPPEGEQPDLFGASPAPAAPAADEDPLRGFDAWYSAYPRKVAKGDARKAWTQALRRGADPDAILTGLLAQVETLRDQQARGFCPYPASWLRAERWEDAPPDNVRRFPSVPAPTETYDPAYAASLPPAPRKDLFG